MSVNPAQIVPEREPGLIRRIAAAVFKMTPSMGPQPQEQNSTGTGRVSFSVNALSDQFRAQLDRVSIYADADEMDETSEEAGVALDIIADDTVSSEDGQQRSFTVTAEDTRAQTLFDDLCARTHLHEEAYSFIRNLVKYGDSFAEIVVDEQGEVVELRQLPPATMHRNQDVYGMLKLAEPKYDDNGNCLNASGECAFEQHDPGSDSVTAAFYPWQIVHCRLNWDGFRKYGRSHLRAARIIWRKLKAIDESIIIARLIRAYPKLKHKIDTTGLAPADAEQTVKKYASSLNEKRTVGTSRDRQYSVQSDLILGAPKVTGNDGKMYENASDIELLEANGQTITNINDVKDYLYTKFILCLRVPRAFMGLEDKINAKATLTNEDVEYARFRRYLQQIVGQSFEQIFDTQLILASMDPDAIEYEITWPAINSSDDAAAANSSFLQAQADQIYVNEGVINAEYLQRHRFDMSDEDIEEMAEEAKEQAAEQAAIAPPPAVPPPAEGAPTIGAQERQLMNQEMALIGSAYEQAMERAGRRMIDEATKAARAAGNGHSGELLEVVRAQGETMTALADRPVPPIKLEITQPEAAPAPEAPKRRTRRTTRFETDDKGHVVGKTEEEEDV